MTKIVLSSIEPTQQMLDAARRAPIPAVHTDSMSRQQDIIFAAKFRAALQAAVQPEVEPSTVISVQMDGHAVVSYTTADGTVTKVRPK